MRWLNGSCRLVLMTAALWFLAVGCRGSAVVTPVIEFSTVPEAADGSSQRLAPIAGRVVGAHPGQRIVLFARSESWWVQPLNTQPFTAIDANATWKTTIHLG